MKNETQCRMEHALMAYYQDKQLQAIYDSTVNWVDTINGNDPTQITNLYSDSGVLLGTVAENIKIGRRMIEGYFEKLVIKKPEVFIDSIMVKALGAAHGVSNGAYTFIVDDEFSEFGRIKIFARFTFIIDLETGLIETHHSSSTPRNTNI